MRRVRATSCFNEASALQRRKHLKDITGESVVKLASMRPPLFSGGNITLEQILYRVICGLQ